MTVLEVNTLVRGERGNMHGELKTYGETDLDSLGDPVCFLVLVAV